MNKIKLSGILFFAALALSCSRVESDARKAAKYTDESIEKSLELKFEEAKKLYDKSQKIIGKYDSTNEESEKFFKHYREYRDGEKTVNQK